jgi:hypothetical protein
MWNIPPPYFAALPVAIVLLAAGVVMPPFGRLDVCMMVDVERAPYPSVASGFFAASSNTRVPSLICPYPPLHPTLLKMHAHPPKCYGMLVVSNLEKHIGRPEREILAPTKSFFEKPNVHGLSRQMRIARIALPALLAPYRAKYVTVTGFPTPTTGRRGDADGPASAPPSGAAAGGRPGILYPVRVLIKITIGTSVKMNKKRWELPHLRPTLIPHPLYSTLLLCLCFLPSPGSSYAGCVGVGGW